jgi:hypothetical protein
MSESLATYAEIESKQVDLESRVYWAAISWDTSSSLSLGHRRSLTSGLKGACSEPTWRLIKSFLVGSFIPKSERWRTEDVEITNEVAYEVIAGATIYRIYIWKNITSLKEALREGVNEDSMLIAWHTLLEVIGLIKSSIRSLLDDCERLRHFLDQRAQLNWFEVKLKHCLGIMVLADALEATGRTDLLLIIAGTIQDAEHDAFSVLKFGLETTYTIYGPAIERIPPMDRTSESSTQMIITSLFAIDPCSQGIIDTVLLLKQGIDRKLRNGSLETETYSYLSSILTDALGQLPHNSKSVQAARGSFQTDSLCYTIVSKTTISETLASN